MTDGQLLDILAWRDAGHKPTEIARAMGHTKSKVIGALWRIDRDLAESEC